MSRFGLLFSLLSVLFLSTFTSADSAVSNLTLTPSAVGASFKSAGWNLVTRAAQFDGRAGGVVEWYTGNVWIGNRYQSGNWLLMYGSGVWTCYDDCAAKEEVWASANKGRTWTQVQMSAPFNPLLSPATVQDNRGYQYRIQGQDSSRGCQGAVYSDVWMSTDGGYKWTQQGDGLPSETGRYLSAAVVDSTNTIYVLQGETCQPGMGNYALNDVWSSSNQGRTWRNVRQGLRSPPARSVHGAVVGKYYDPTTKASVDAMYIMYGWRGSLGDGIGNLYRNDVWVTTNGAVSWTQLTDKASWTARGDSQLEVTKSGVLVIAGGVSNIEGTERRELNDVWASLDGGYTWGICSDNAKWDDRTFQFTAIDNEGYLYVIAGRATDPSGTGYLANDVWVSTQSFDDPAQVAEMCGLVVPPCGVGLYCLRDETFVQGVWGVSCAACQWSPTSGSSAAAATTMTMTYLFVAFLLATIALAAVVGYLLYRMKQSGNSPIPLPGSAQRWWNDKQGGGEGGLNEGLNKGNTASEADTMYNPLTIRDQM